MLCGERDFAIVGLGDLGERMLDRLVDHGGSRRSLVRFCQRAGVELTRAAAVAAMVAGGYLSDRLGRRRMLALYIACIGLPVLYLMAMLTQYGWIMPVGPNAPNRPGVPAALVTALWIASLVYSLFNGLMYGTRSAIMMDVTNPRVAATQFTAYMALMNLTISYSAAWQGIAAEAWGYLSEAFTNVIGNAVKYSRDGSKVTVKAEENGNDIVISVRDEGVGIAQEDLPHIFEGFYRGKSGQAVASGHGIGLAVTRQIIEAHKGSIAVESELSKGATFIVRLPMATA